MSVCPSPSRVRPKLPKDAVTQSYQRANSEQCPICEQKDLYINFHLPGCLCILEGNYKNKKQDYF